MGSVARSRRPHRREIAQSRFVGRENFAKDVIVEGLKKAGWVEAEKEGGRRGRRIGRFPQEPQLVFAL